MRAHKAVVAHHPATARSRRLRPTRIPQKKNFDRRPSTQRGPGLYLLAKSRCRETTACKLSGSSYNIIVAYLPLSHSISPRRANCSILEVDAAQGEGCQSVGGELYETSPCPSERSQELLLTASPTENRPKFFAGHLQQPLPPGLGRCDQNVVHPPHLPCAPRY